MIPAINKLSNQESIDRAFSKQSTGYDFLDVQNPILRDLRLQVYDHVKQFIKPRSLILELNAGTGIDALHFISLGHRVHAIDLAEGMISQIKKKTAALSLASTLTYQRLSFEDLDQVNVKNVDFVFSNFGGLNCIDDLSKVTRHLPSLLVAGARITWVIMPTVCPMEIASVVKGHHEVAFRRFRKVGATSHLEGEHFQTFYFTLTQIKKAFGPRFRFIRAEGLAALSPQPHSVKWVNRNPRLYKALRSLDRLLRNHYPFNRWADHLIVTFEFIG